jgi:CBS domain-containing protein
VWHVIETDRPTARAAEAEPLVQDIMTRRLVAIRSDAELTVAVDAFWRHGRRHLLVVDADRRCRGLVSAEHVLAALATAGPGRRTVGAHLPPGPPRVHRHAPVREAAQVMLTELVDALPVVDDDGRVVGVVTWTDILAMVAGRHLTPRPGREGQRIRPARPAG